MVVGPAACAATGIVGWLSDFLPIGSRSWAFYWNMDQYFVVDPCDERRGWGFFVRHGAADPDASPIRHFASGGLGGNSLIASRKADTWGVGYYHAWNNEGFYTRLLGFDDQARGVEAYDRAMITPDFDVTGDIQLLDGALPSADEWAIVPGVRANLRF